MDLWLSHQSLLLSTGSDIEHRKYLGAKAITIFYINLEVQRYTIFTKLGLPW